LTGDILICIKKKRVKIGCVSCVWHYLKS